MNDTPAASAGSDDDADDLLVAELSRVAGVADPVPEAWAAVAHDAFGWARLPGLAARLTYDSNPAPDAQGAAPVASTAVRTVRFTAGAGPALVRVEVELDIGADKIRVLGRVDPGRPGPVVAVAGSGRTVAEADAEGGFRFDELPRRPFCVLVDGPQPVKTGWIVT